MRLSALSAITVAGALVFAQITGATATPPPPIPKPTSNLTPSPKPKTSSITLLTGDQVKVVQQQGQPDQVSFVPGKGSRSGTASVLRNGNHVYALPPGIAPQIATGRLDKDLFDVTTLLAAGYDDAHSRTLPVIVTYAGSTTVARTRAVQAEPQGAKTSKALTSVGARAVAIDKSAGNKFWTTAASTTIKQIRLDHRIRAVTDQSVPQIGAPEAWKRGLTGKGVKVAVLDSGIDATHPDLAGRVIAQENFSDSPEVTDHAGHGTHVAGILAGTGAASGGKYRGVAPDASLLNGKVLDDQGSGSESGVIAGMEWAVAQGAKVVNLSLGGGPTDGTDPVSQALDTLSAQSGALFVVAAGNCFFRRAGVGLVTGQRRCRPRGRQPGPRRCRQRQFVPRPPRAGPGDEAGDLRTRRRHRRRPCRRYVDRRPGRRELHRPLRYVDGHTPRRRYGGTTRGRTPGLERRPTQDPTDVHR